MAYSRSRVNLTLGDVDSEQLADACRITGRMGTKVVMDAYRLGLPLLLAQVENNRKAMQFAKMVASQEDIFEKPKKPRTNTQRKSDRKKKK